VSKEEIKERFKYSLKQWINRLGSYPVRQVQSVDYSEAYTMRRCHVFELENGEYATVTESGCSCYTPREADIELHPSEKKAVSKLEEWESNQRRF